MSNDAVFFNDTDTEDELSLEALQRRARNTWILAGVVTVVSAVLMGVLGDYLASTAPAEEAARLTDVKTVFLYVSAALVLAALITLAVKRDRGSVLMLPVYGAMIVVLLSMFLGITAGANANTSPTLSGNPEVTVYR